MPSSSRSTVLSGGDGRHAAKVGIICTVYPAPSGLAVATAKGDRILPWKIAADLLDDPQLTVQTCGIGDCSPWAAEHLLTALIAGDPAAHRLLAVGEPPLRPAVRDLPRYPRTWARTLVCEVMIGDLDAACCRAGLALPGTDPLAIAAAIDDLMRRQGGQIRVRERLLADHPWIGDQAWLATTGQLAEAVVTESGRRSGTRIAVAAGEMEVAELLGAPERFSAQHPEVSRVIAAILVSTASWDERGRLGLAGVAWQWPVGGMSLTLGVGGLHSQDAAGTIAGPLVDLDVASYYPSIIAQERIAPAQMPEFSQRVARLLARRLAAKRAGDQTASLALKLVINSLYGQLGNARSGLFSPADALRVVLTGQLRLLQLMDGVLMAGGRLISANTDGILVAGAPEAAAVAWEAATGFSLERTAYGRLWRTSVNDYIASAPDGSVRKTRGRFAGGDDDALAARRAAAPVVARAVVEHLVAGRPLAAVIASAEVPEFTLWRRARELTWGGQPVPDCVVRWIVGASGTPLVQVTANRERSTVAARAIPVADPARFDPALIDREWYLSQAQELVDKVLGTALGAKQLSLFD